MPAPLCHLHMADVVEIAAQLLLKHSPAEVEGRMFCVASAVSIAVTAMLTTFACSIEIL